MDEKEIQTRLEKLDDAGRTRALARLIALVVGRSDRARNLALRAAEQALKSAQIALKSAKTARTQSASGTDFGKRLAKQEEALQEALQRIEAAINAADSLLPGRRRVEEHISKLTRREKEVYFLLARGKTDKEIAKQLGIASRTVQLHVTNIKPKLGIEDRDDFILPFPLLS